MNNISHKSGIYKIQNIVTGKYYIGSTVDFGQRKSSHFSRLKRNAHTNSHLQNSYNKYGCDCFEFIILEHCPIRDLHIVEQKYLDYYKSNGIWDTIYNTSFSVSVPMRGRNHTKETKLKISKNNKRYFLGKKLSLETRAKISASKKGKKFSQQHITNLKISFAKRNNSRIGFYGKTHTEETKLKISQTKKGKSGIKVNQICRNTLVILNTFSSATQAGEYFNFKSPSKIGACARGERKSAYGFLWRYVD